MESKLARPKLLRDELAAISEKASPQRKVQLHLLLMSPNEPQKLNWPESLKPGGSIPHVKLNLASNGRSILDVSRCDENGVKMVSTSHWRVGQIKK